MKPGFSSKASCGVARQYTGSTGKITNCQIAYVSGHSHAFIDRALYLPKGSTDDPARLTAAYVPDNVGFSTKPRLAVEMIERALAAGVPFRWVAADTVYGVGDIERDLRRVGKGYVLGVNANHWFASWGKPQRVAGTADEIAKTQQPSDWRRLSDSFETTKNELELDHNETGPWHGWHRHVSLVMLAFAMMAAIQHQAQQVSARPRHATSSVGRFTKSAS